MKSQVSRWAAMLALPVALAGVAACGGSEAPPAEEATPAAAEPATPPPAAERRVFFVEPQDGAEVTSPVTLRFGVEEYEISPVPPGEFTTAREGLGHHHVAIDTDCLPVGTAIPKADPWVHFGTGNNEIEMMLPPGQHRLTLQIGDDLHRTQEGLCSTITVNVAGQ
ncbi:MAG: DUF4399 domain-containing protein [Vicinamibacterales bacterium]